MQLLAPAKINLFLKVTGKRPDGYHELFSLMCPVSLYDRITFQFGEKRITVKCSNPSVPSDDSNLAHRAAVLFYQTTRITGGVHLSIEKNIPVAGGLGGGSSNAATVLLGLNSHYDVPLSTHELSALGKQLGADVPFFIYQKPAIATGIGDILEPFEKLKPYNVLLLYPGFGVSTREIFRKYNFGLTNSKKIHKCYPFNEGGFEITRHMCNDLETTSVALYPDIQRAKDTILAHGADGAVMSGSGSCVFGIFSDTETAERGYDSIDREHPYWQLFLVDFVR